MILGGPIGAVGPPHTLCLRRTRALYRWQIFWPTCPATFTALPLRLSPTGRPLRRPSDSSAGRLFLVEHSVFSFGE